MGKKNNLLYQTQISCRPNNSIEITFENNSINTLSEHFSLAKKFVFLLYIEFETEQLKFFTQSLTTSYDFMVIIFLNALLTANYNDLSP